MKPKALPASALLAVLLCAPVSAEILSRHNELPAAINAAQGRLYDAGCQRTAVNRVGTNDLSTVDGSKSLLITFYVGVTCTRWKPATTPVIQQPIAIDLTWSHPTTRINGAPFSPSEVARYEVDHNGAVINVGTGTSSTINEPGPGPHLLRIRTIDTRSQISAWSPSITLE